MILLQCALFAASRTLPWISKWFPVYNIKILVIFNFFQFLIIFCWSLNLSNLQVVVLGGDFVPITSLIPNLSLIILCTFSSHLSQISHHFPPIPPILELFFSDQSSNSISLSVTLPGFKKSTPSLKFLF